MAFDVQYSMRLDDFADLNPPRPLKKGAIAKLIDMAALPTNHRSISLASIEIRPYSSGARFKNGDSLLARITPCLENGKSAFVNCLQQDEVAAGSTEFIVIAPKKGVDADFVYYASCFPEFRQHAISRMEGTSGRQRVSHHSIADFEFPYICTEDRIAIGSMLRSLDDRIDHNRALATNLEAIARRLFKSWFVDFDPVSAKVAGEKPAGLADDIAALFPDRFVESEIGEVPEGWAISKLGDLCTLIKGRSYKSSDLAESKTALVTLKSFRRGGGFRSDGFKSYTGTYKEEQIIHSGECVIAFTDVTQQADVIGRAALVQSSPLHETLIASLDTAILRSKVDGLTPQFLYLVCQTDAYVEHVLKFVTGSTVLHLAKDAVPTYAFALPSEKLLIEFNAISSPIFEKIKCSQAEITRLTDLRDLLLPRLISGKLRVEDAETVIEEAVA